jgi:transcriptional regulator with XRE-family HTH domain
MASFVFAGSTNVEQANTSQHIIVEKTNTHSERFREIRKLLGLTQQQLADRLLITRNYVAQIESGFKKEPSARVLRDLELLSIDQANGLPVRNVDQVKGDKPDGIPVKGNVAAGVLLRRFQRLLNTAGSNPQRLAWIAEQMDQHLEVPGKWTSAREILEKVDAVESALRNSGTRSHQKDHGAPQRHSG